MNDRVQRLYAAIEHLGKMRYFRDVANGNTRVAQCVGGPASRDDLPIQLTQAARELDQAGFIGNGEQCAGHEQTLGIGNWLLVVPHTAVGA